MSRFCADIVKLRASWQTVRGGWPQAWRDARELIVQRRILVKTSASTKQGHRLVLCTRLRLIGDTQTDVLRDWLGTTPVKDVTVVTETHFRAVDAAMEGWNIALAMERVLLQITSYIGLLIAATSFVTRIITAPSLLLRSWPLWFGLALPLLAQVVRIILRWRLRALFARA
jgi:membrane protein insertase Oxa1/YidC/SpoIIIJ